MSTKLRFGIPCLLILTAFVSVALSFWQSPITAIIIVPFAVMFGLIMYEIVTRIAFEIRYRRSDQSASDQSEI